MILADLTTFLTTTGTAGTTLTTEATDYSVTLHGIIGIGIILLLFIIAHLLDRRLNRQYELESTEEEEA